MPAFEFQALSASGRNEQGLLEADSPRHARQLLRERGLSPVRVQEVAQGSEPIVAASGKSAAKRGGIALNGSQLALLTRQLSTLSRAGLPLDEALSAVSQQSEDKRAQRLALALRASISEGESLANAMLAHPQAFPVLYRSTVEAGEQAGKLDVIMDRLADYVERQQEMRSKLMQAAIYPIIMLIIAISVVMVMMTYVVPQIVAVFDQIDTQLPLLTRTVISISDFLRAWWRELLIVAVLVPFLFERAMRGEGFKYRMHERMLGWPVVGRIVRAANAGRFARTLGILFGSGVPILDAMRIGSQVVANLPMREAVEEAAKKVREGAPLGRSLSTGNRFPPLVVHLISSGESSGRLEEMLHKAAENQEREVESRISVLMRLMEPIMTVVMGIIVLLIVMAILLPIFDLNTLVK